MASTKKPPRVRNPRLIAIHPGEMLRKEFKEPLKVTQTGLVAAIGAPEVRAVLREEQPLTAELALRLGKYFGIPAEEWMNMQRDYDLRVAANAVRLGRIKPLRIA